MNGRWPSNFVLVHSPPDAHSEGCERVGVRRVKAGTWGATQNTQCGSGGTMSDGWAQRPTVNPGIADPDGMEVVDDWRCVEGCVVKKLGEQSGISKSSGGGGAIRYGLQNRSNENMIEYPNNVGLGDKGTCARFFFQADWSYERIEWEELWNGRMADSLR